MRRFGQQPFLKFRIDFGIARAGIAVFEGHQ